MSVQPDARSNPVIIKKYANRRLYNTSTSSYVTLDNLGQMVRDGYDFIVYDAKNGDDITRSVLTQIIVEEEQKGQNLLPISFLRQIIGFYGNNMQWLVPRYLEFAMKSFAHNQEQLSQTMTKNMGGAFGGLFGPFEEMSKQNMALFEKTIKMFSPFDEGHGHAAPGAAANVAAGAAPAPASVAETRPDPALRDLVERVNQLQGQLDALSARGADEGAKTPASKK